ncbi:PepSY domain-containing protein [Sphingomonas cannabina]|uniref:PepSY-associated TM helix domain-containing protein n=1 Tax=Sphingomonas cannabina TaxID=2899123 RepID=UPI001F251F82|nr:PepSY-associated TM helix domain-containing protein [Sphingomonas cannabina]UIJ44836.1 PepSY domain-containing protein [Sphingomonas cannabina]
MKAEDMTPVAKGGKLPGAGWTIPPNFVRAVLKGHSSLGLAFAAAIYIVCLTGTIAVFARELQRWENPAAPRLARVSPEAVQRAYSTAALRAGPGLEHVYITLPAPDLPRLMVTTDARGGERDWIADGEGQLIESRSIWTEFLTRLHINLHLPRTWGVFLVGMTGVALLSSLISGLLAHPRIFRDAFHLRIGGSRRLQEADLHNRIGVWALPFHLTVSLTGAFLGLTTLIVGVLGLAVFQGDVGKVYALFQPPRPAQDERRAPPIDLRPMFAEVAARNPQGRIDYVFLEHPTEMGGAALFNVTDGSTRLSQTDAYAFDRSARLYHAKRARENNLGERVLASLGTLHFGWFGGGAIKIGYGLLGLGLSYLAAGGVSIWLARRRDKGRPTSGWERIWTAVVWGQPLALAASAAATLVVPAPVIALVVWGVISLAALSCAAWLPSSQIGRMSRTGTAALLILTAILHITLRGGRDPAAWTVDGVLFALGVLMLSSLRRRRKSNPAPIQVVPD